jgi:hypothetical protein
MRVFCIISLLFLLAACDNTENKSVVSNLPKRDSTFTKTDTMPANYPGVDISPMDMSYYPANYPFLKMTKAINTPPVMRIIYSRPHLAGRKLFLNLLKKGEPWRMGANESTEIDFYQPVTIQGKKIKPGRYILYCVPQTDKWIIILNSSMDSWGLKIDATKDLEKFPVSFTNNNPHIEYLTMLFEKSDSGADLVIAWDDIIARLPINF